MGNYESWARVMGGILGHVGIDGFLGNVEEVYDAADEELGQWEAFFMRWWEEYGEREVTVSELFNLADQEDLLLVVRGDKGERSQKIRLGRGIARQRDRQIGQYKVIQAGEDGRSKAAIYKLLRVDVVMDAAYEVAAGGEDDAPY